MFITQQLIVQLSEIIAEMSDSNLSVSIHTSLERLVKGWKFCVVVGWNSAAYSTLLGGVCNPD